MAGSVNKVILVGNLGADPEIRNMQSGDKVANFTLATSESWKDKSGERKERVQWHKVVIFNQNVVGVAEKYLKKGAKVYIEGQLETRTWEKDGVKQYTTEVILKPFNGSLTMLDSKGDTESVQRTEEWDGPSKESMAFSGKQPDRVKDEFEDEIPF